MPTAVICLTVILSLAPVAPNAVAPAKRAAQQHILWTNDEIEQLPGAAAAAPSTIETLQDMRAEAAAAEIPFTPYVREQDADWQRQRLEPLQNELAQIAAQTAKIRGYLANPLDRSEPGLVLGPDAPSMRLTPENELQQLATRRAEIERQISGVQDEVRRNRIAPGAIR